MTNTETLPRVVASDIGGTLIQGIAPLPPFTARVLNRLIEKNIPVVLITGYNYHTALTFTRDLDDRIILILQNGTLCMKAKEPIWEYRISEADAHELLLFLEQNDLPIIVYKGKTGDFKNYYMSRKEIPYLAYGFERIFQPSDFENITGISTWLPDEKAKTFKVKIQEIVGDKFKVIYSRGDQGSWLEVVHTEVRKDLSLERLCENLSIPLTSVVYFGDNFNDLEVLRLVGYPVVVENADPELKKEFKTIIPSVDKEGEAYYLNDLFNLEIPPSG